MSTTSGTVNFRPFHTWYTITGDLHAQRPLVVLHGGPGITHNYLTSMRDLWPISGIPVVLYDQLGCGNSTHLPYKGADFWSVELFVDELDNLLDKLGMLKGEFDLLGHSWGGMLAAEYVVRKRPSGLRHVVFASAPSSMDLWIEEANRLKGELPSEVKKVLDKLEALGKTENPAYEDAMGTYYGRHMCRVQPFPEELMKCFEVVKEDPTVPLAMSGSSEVRVSGILNHWSIIDRLSSIRIPTLVTNGKYDQATDAVVGPYVDNIAGAKWVQFENSGHMPHLEERETFLKVVSAFLKDEGDPGIPLKQDVGIKSLQSHHSIKEY